MNSHKEKSNFSPISMAAIMENIYETRRPIVRGLIYAGAYLFAGAPKVGKSFFVAQLAYHVSTGQALWGYDVKKCTVLYLALEDDEKRIQQRMFQMFGAESAPDNLFFSTKISLLANGLENDLKKFIQEHKDTGLIIIDTLQKIRGKENDTISYAKDYDAVSQLKEFADKNDLCIILVHHTRKQISDDPFDMISGTNGLAGAVDCSIVMSKEKRTSDHATLQFTGRDQTDQKITVKRDAERLIWLFENAETELWKETPEPVLELIAKYLTQEAPLWCGTPSELAEKIKTDLQPNALSTMLNVRAGKLKDKYGICYEKGRNHGGRFIKLTFCGLDA